jgi:hypothetical protein
VIDALAALNALSYPTRSTRPSYLTRLGPAHSRESFQEFAPSIERMHLAQLSNPALQFAFRSNVFVTYRSSTVTQCRDRAKLEKSNVRLLCPLPKARKSVFVLARESVPPRNSSLGRSLSSAQDDYGRQQEREGRRLDSSHNRHASIPQRKVAHKRDEWLDRRRIDHFERLRLLLGRATPWRRFPIWDANSCRKFWPQILAAKPRGAVLDEIQGQAVAPPGFPCLSRSGATRCCSSRFK